MCEKRLTKLDGGRPCHPRKENRVPPRSFIFLFAPIVTTVRTLFGADIPGENMERSRGDIETKDGRKTKNLPRQSVTPVTIHRVFIPRFTEIPLAHNTKTVV